ncbi:hypothetical protein K501DRAFT_279134 [Backusella circina FSU 941]|nr:hypothetical protein K501DRAFT_279134 [Backusella circina FSU 941]
MSNPDISTKVVTTEGEIIIHNEPIPTENYLAQVLSREVRAPDSTVVDADQANIPLSNSFLFRLCSLPLIQDGLDTVEFYASKTSLSKFALEQTKTTFDKATAVASHITNKYKSQIDKVDQLGCRSLDVLEDKFPIVRQHPSEVLTEVKASPRKFYNGAKDKLTTTVSRPITFATDNLEFLIDKYLPGREDNNVVIDESTMTETKRLMLLANQVMDRIVYHLEFVYSKADIHQLVETNRLLSSASRSIKDIYNRLFETVKSFKGECQTESSKRLDYLTVNLIHHLDQAIQFMKLHLIYLGPFQPLINPLVNFVNHEYDIIRGEAIKSDLGPLEKATNIIQLTHDYVLPLIQGSLNNVQKQINHSGVYFDDTTDIFVNNAKSDVAVKT